MGRGSSGAQAPTNARQIENMNEAQISRELAKERRRLASAQRARQQAGAGTTEEDALRQAFPLGTGGLNRTQAQERAGRMATQAVDRGKRLEAAIKRQNDAESRIKKLEAAQREIRGTGKTQAQLAEERRAAQIKAAGSSMKWTTTNAGGFSNGGYTPKTIRSGAFEIRGSSGRFTVYENGNRIGTVSKLAEAKAIAERRRSRQR